MRPIGVPRMAVPYRGNDEFSEKNSGISRVWEDAPLTVFDPLVEEREGKPPRNVSSAVCPLQVFALEK